MPQIRKYYDSYDVDMVESRNQNFELPKKYEWIPDSPSFQIKSKICYRLAMIFAFFYSHIVWRMRVVGREKLIAAGNTGYFMYGNHTQPFGDVFLPGRVNKGKRIYTIVSPSNYGIPIIGKILPYLGALPIPSDRRQIKVFIDAIHQRTAEGNAVIIFPEAHVWPYCTKIRPYTEAAFHYPIAENLPVFAMTTTYQERRWGRKPRLTVYIDGPFLPNASLKRKEQKEKLCAQVRNAMEERSRNNTVEWIHYEKCAEESYTEEPCDDDLRKKELQ